MSTGGSSLARALHSEAEQLSMLGADASPDEIDALRGADGRLPSNAFRTLRRQRTGKPGRPLGAVNKRSEQLAKLVIQEFGDPVLGGASLYAMPLDQLCELLLVADGTQEREERLEELTGALAAQVNELAAAVKLAARRGSAEELTKAADRIADAAESLESLGKSRGKAGVLALQALNVQLTARRFVAEYVHSKRPVAVDVTHRTDGLLVMPGAGQVAGEAAFVQEGLNAALKTGKIEADQVARLEFRDGRLIDPEGEIEEADFAPVEGEDDDDG
jgi:hypothetical protein